MDEFSRIIWPEDQQFYEHAIKELNQAGSTGVAIVSAEDLPSGMMLMNISFTNRMDLFLLGFKVGQLKLEREQDNG